MSMGVARLAGGLKKAAWRRNSGTQASGKLDGSAPGAGDSMASTCEERRGKLPQRLRTGHTPCSKQQ